jgi:hypothetical protein
MKEYVFGNSIDFSNKFLRVELRDGGNRKYD